MPMRIKKSCILDENFQQQKTEYERTFTTPLLNEDFTRPVEIYSKSF